MGQVVMSFIGIWLKFSQRRRSFTIEDNYLKENISPRKILLIFFNLKKIRPEQKEFFF